MNEQIRAMNELKKQNIAAQKRGIHFLLTAVIIFIMILVIQILPFSLMKKNLLTFCAAAPMMPIAYGISRVLHIDFQNKGNPFSSLGLFFTLNQMMYLLIPMWALNGAPEQMLMFYLLIFGAHLLPYGWLYNSKSYIAFSIVILAAVFILGLFGNRILMAGAVLLIQIAFCISIIKENSSNI